MNPPSPREELEIRITALLMGELPPDEAAALQTQIAADAELAALHARLRRAAELLREASAIPEQPTPPEPARLSSERRERLLAHFKTPPAAPHVVVLRVVKPRRDWKWAVPIGLAASLIALIGGAMFVNGFGLRKGSHNIEKMLARSGSEELEESAASTVMSQIRDANRNEGNGRDAWGSQPGMIRGVAANGKDSGRSWGFKDKQAADSSHAFFESRDGLRESGMAARGRGAATVTGKGGKELEDLSGTIAAVADPSARAANGTGTLYLPGAAEISADVASSAPMATASELVRASEPAGRVQALSEESVRAASNPFRGPGVAGGDTKAPHPAATPPPMLSYAWGGAAKSDPNQSTDLFYNNAISANVAKAPAESAPESIRPAAMAQAAVEGLELPGLRPGGGGGEALAEDGKKTDTLDVNGAAGVVLSSSISGTGGLTKNGNGTLVLSGANAYGGGTVISGGTLRTENAAAAVPGAKDNLPPATPTPSAKAVVEDNFGYYKTEGESRVVLGTSHRGLGVAAESDLKDVSGPDDRKAGGQTSPATTSLGLAPDVLGKSLAWSEEGRKKEADKRGEMSEKLEEGFITKGVKSATTARQERGAGIGGTAFPMTPTTPTTPTAFALGDQPASIPSPVVLGILAAVPSLGGDKDQLGDVRVDYGIPLKETAGSSPGSGKFQYNVGDKIGAAASEDGRKTAHAPHAAEFEGFINYGSPISTPPIARPGIAATNSNAPLAFNEGGITNGSRAVKLRTANPEGDRKPQDNPVAGGIAFWNEDDTSKANINTTDRAANVPAREPSSALPKDGPDMATVSGVITGTGAVTLNKAGAGNWQLDGASTFTGTTTMNGGTLISNNGGAAAPATVTASTNALTFGGSGATNGTFAGVTTKGGQRARVEATREFNYPTEFQAPEIPKTIGAGGGGIVSKAGDGPLSLGESSTFSGSINVNASDVRGNLPVADEAPRKLNEELSKDPHNTSANNVREEAANLKDRSAGAGPARATATGEANQESTRAHYSRFDRQAKDGKGDAAKKEPAALKGLSVAEPFAETADLGVANYSRISSAAGKPVGTDVEAKLPQALQKLQDGETEELRAKSDVPLLGDVPLTGKLFRDGTADATPAAPAEGLTAALPPTPNNPENAIKVDDKPGYVKSPYDTQGRLVDVRGLPPGAEAEDPYTRRKFLLPQATERLEKKLAETSAVEAEKEEAKKVVEQIRDPEPAAPKPAPNPLVPQPEIRTGANAFSTFSLNVSDVAFKLAGASLEHGTMPDVSTLRSEEFINAFDYRDPEPAAGAPLGFVSERARYPFAQNRDLVRFSVKTAAAGRQPGRPLNIVLLLDNSGSMERADRVRIVREAMRVLSAQLTPQDKLSIVTFSRTPRLWADGVSGDKAGEVTARVGEITPEGGTNLAAALDLGYTTALRHYQAGSINHVVVLTDGAANLGNVDPAALKQKVEAHRKQGVALDCFGIGWEGLNDDMLEQLSRNGDGRYGFINTPEEAATNFAGQLAGALRVAASDVKVQVEWNPKRVTAYRQIGYAKHQLTKEQFRDNTVDAAEIGAAESGNALYVVEVNPRGEGDLATVRVRFKVPGTSDYREHEWAVPFTANAAPLEQSSSTLRLAATASAFSEMLAGSPFATEVTSDRLLGLLNGVPAIYGADPRPKKLEWMIRTAKSLSGR